MGGGGEKSIVHAFVVVKSVDEGGEQVLLNVDHFVFTLVDSTFDTVGFVVVHGIAHGEATHEVGDTGSFAPEVFAQDEVKMIGKQEEGMESDGTRPKLRGVAFADDCLGSQSLHPGQGSRVGEAEVIG